MTMTDPIADLFTRIRNASLRRYRRVDAPWSRLKVGIAIVLKEEGYIEDFEVVPEERKLRVTLRYDPRGACVLRSIRRVSRPGHRVYAGVRELPRPLRGIGTAIVSTPRGVVSDRKARSLGVGGEVLGVVT
jgi:small subunit ribosomal protein S8